MKIRLLSDLHTEFRLPYKTHPMSEYRGEDVLVLAGDIASGSTNTMDVIKHFKSVGFPHIIYVPGNHEYYGTSVQDFDSKMREKCAKLTGVHFLNGDTIILNNVRFIGASLWTNFNDNPISEHAARTMIADFKHIKGFKPSGAKDMYRRHLEYIKMQHENRAQYQQSVIVTHFLPAQVCISPRFRADYTGLNDYFANRLDDWIYEMTDATWLFGHTHDTVDTVVGTTRLVANPHGYYTAMDEGKFFDPFKTIEL